MGKNRDVLPIFFAVDDGYIPFLAVALESLIANSSANHYYLIKILYTNINEENREKIKKYERDNVSIEFVDLNYYIEIRTKLQQKQEGGVRFTEIKPFGGAELLHCQLSIVNCTLPYSLP